MGTTTTRQPSAATRVYRAGWFTLAAVGAGLAGMFPAVAGPDHATLVLDDPEAVVPFGGRLTEAAEQSPRRTRLERGSGRTYLPCAAGAGDDGAETGGIGHLDGISTGWADSYTKHLEISGIPDGDYLLELVVDPGGVFHESDAGDNRARNGIRLRGETAEVVRSSPPHGVRPSTAFVFAQGGRVGRAVAYTSRPV